MTFLIESLKVVLQERGVVPALIVAGLIAIGCLPVLVLLQALVQAAVRAWRRWQLRRELRVLRGGRPSPLFTVYPELEEPPRPPLRSLRRRRDHARGENDAA